MAQIVHYMQIFIRNHLRWDPCFGGFHWNLHTIDSLQATDALLALTRTSSSLLLLLLRCSSSDSHNSDCIEVVCYCPLLSHSPRATFCVQLVPYNQGIHDKIQVKPKPPIDYLWKACVFCFCFILHKVVMIWGAIERIFDRVLTLAPTNTIICNDLFSC